MSENEKRVFLKELVKNEKVIDELITYTENKFTSKDKTQLPLRNHDNSIKTWEKYYQESQEIGCFNTLKKYLVQLQFPVQRGISKTENYRNTTLKGKQKLGEESLVLNQPNHLTLELYENEMIGKIPIILVPNNDDFNTFICALSNKNEPKKLPESMGALFINGLNNWDRIHTLKETWLQKYPFGNWNEKFRKEILPNPQLFKDKLFVLSTKDYSGVKSSEVGVLEKKWKNSSFIIRREHECAHLFTLQKYGCMANNIHDEIIADYAGITKVLGQFNKEWFLHFMGLENYPVYRVGARLQNYKQPLKLSEMAFDVLKTLMKKISDTIYSFDITLGKISTSEDRIHRIETICEVDMITMASRNGYNQLIEKYKEKVLLT